VFDTSLVAISKATTESIVGIVDGGLLSNNLPFIL
jgi:hypothetical protein